VERTLERIRAHYEVEKELADRLRYSTAADRRDLYGRVYDELLQRVPDHPRLTRKVHAGETQERVEELMRLLHRFLKPDTAFLEIGAGDCNLSLAAAGRVRKCYALEVSREILDKVRPAGNMELVLSTGRDIPLPDGSVSLAYSNQVIEHVHTEDAEAQFRSVYRVLAKGGRYLCITPNRANGPHDVSRYFDPVATGLHIKEYSFRELDALFRRVGFTRTDAWVGVRGHYASVPLSLVCSFEALILMLPSAVRKAVGQLPVARNLLFITLIGTKE
jgi:ubiquinone/menaquinone biosynthesis C-methylase UbiE